MVEENKLVSVKIPKYLHEIIKGLSKDTGIPVQKLVEILLTKSPKIKTVLRNIE